MNKAQLISFKNFQEKALQDPKIKKHYDDLEEEFALAEKIIRKRIEKGLTQKQLAEKMGTKQSAIARLESGNYNPSFLFLTKIAHALETQLKISF